MLPKQLILQREQRFDNDFSQTLKIAENHGLKRDRFFYVIENKKKEWVEKRISAQDACELLLKETVFKDFKMFPRAKVSYYLPPGEIYGSFSQTEITILLTQILQEVGEEKLLKTHFVR